MNNVAVVSMDIYKKFSKAVVMGWEGQILDEARVSHGDRHKMERFPAQFEPGIDVVMEASNSVHPGIGSGVSSLFGLCSFKPCRCPRSRAADCRVGEDVISPEGARAGSDVAHPERPKARGRVEGQRQREASLPTSNDHVRTSYGVFSACGAELLDG